MSNGAWTRRKVTRMSGGIQSVERAAAIVRVLASQNEPMALTQLVCASWGWPDLIATSCDREH